MKKIMWILLFLFLILLIMLWIWYKTDPVFGARPTGAHLEKIRMSPNYRDGKFQNLKPTPILTVNWQNWDEIWGFLWDSDPNSTPKSEIQSVKTNLFRLPEKDNFYIWFGHSSYLIQLNGKRFLIDPVFESMSPLPFGGKPFKGADIYHAADMPEIDYLIITHDHYDHLEYSTIQALKHKIKEKAIVPLGVGAHLARWGYDEQKWVELDWYDNYWLDKENNFKITALPARHASGRGLKMNQALWASFMLHSPNHSVYLGGDSSYDDELFKKIAYLFPKIDLAILENGQYSEYWAHNHTLPAELPLTIKDLNPKKVVTVHHAKFKLAKHDWQEPLNHIEKIRKIVPAPISTPQIGEIWYFDKNDILGHWWRYF